MIEGIMEARSPRLSEIATRMAGNETASYKRMQRFLQDNDPQGALRTLFNKEAGFVIGDPTELERPLADQTEYVGTLRNGETKDFWMLTSVCLNGNPLFPGRTTPFRTGTSREFY